MPVPRRSERLLASKTGRRENEAPIDLEALTERIATVGAEDPTMRMPERAPALFNEDLARIDAGVSTSGEGEENVVAMPADTGELPSVAEEGVYEMPSDAVSSLPAQPKPVIPVLRNRGAAAEVRYGVGSPAFDKPTVAPELPPVPPEKAPEVAAQAIAEVKANTDKRAGSRFSTMFSNAAKYGALLVSLLGTSFHNEAPKKVDLEPTRDVASLVTPPEQQPQAAPQAPEAQKPLTDTVSMPIKSSVYRAASDMGFNAKQIQDLLKLKDENGKPFSERFINSAPGVESLVVTQDAQGNVTNMRVEKTAKAAQSIGQNNGEKSGAHQTVQTVVSPDGDMQRAGGLSEQVYGVHGNTQPVDATIEVGSVGDGGRGVFVQGGHVERKSRDTSEQPTELVDAKPTTGFRWDVPKLQTDAHIEVGSVGDGGRGIYAADGRVELKPWLSEDPSEQPTEKVDAKVPQPEVPQPEHQFADYNTQMKALDAILKAKMYAPLKLGNLEFRANGGGYEVRTANDPEFVPLTPELMNRLEQLGHVDFVDQAFMQKMPVMISDIEYAAGLPDGNAYKEALRDAARAAAHDAN